MAQRDRLELCVLLKPVLLNPERRFRTWCDVDGGVSSVYVTFIQKFTNSKVDKSVYVTFSQKLNKI
jgi:hypothetical protein